MRQRGSESATEESCVAEREREREQRCRKCKVAPRDSSRRGCCAACYQRLYTRMRYHRTAAAIGRLCVRVETVQVSELVEECEREGVSRREEDLVEVARAVATKPVVDRSGQVLSRQAMAAWVSAPLSDDECKIFDE